MAVVSATIVRPPLRWAGSKRKSLSVLRQYKPRDVTTYIEPFAGSACLAFTLGQPKMILGDINPRLIEFYEYLRDDPERLHAAYSVLPGNPEQYYRVRAEYNESVPSLARAARFLYLNRHCFNGIYRVNARGAFNVPWGGDKVGKPLSRDELVTASKALSSARLICGDFERVVLDNIDEHSFIYLDPPYASNETRVFREYHEDSFATDDWDRFVEVLRKIDSVGARFLLSYAGAPLEARFGDWNVGHLDVTRNVGGFRATRRKHREFVAMNFDPVA